jgi:hypothetical protein
VSRRGRLVCVAAALVTAVCLAALPMGMNALLVLAVWLGTVVGFIELAVLIDVLIERRHRRAAREPWRGSLEYRIAPEVRDRWKAS